MRILRILGPALFSVVVWVLPAMAQTGGNPAPPGPPEEGIFGMARWSPYVVGAGIGVLTWLSALLSGNHLGASTAYVKTSALIERANPKDDAVHRLSYYRQLNPLIDWGWMLVVGIVVGAMLSAVLSGSFRLEFTPGMWKDAIGSTPIIRWFTALAGGILVAFGARWAGGCTSGHGISGTLQLGVSSWLALFCFFAGGALTAHVLHFITGI
ncbi:MAG: YeeE/YedE thiosulfate transporter family protein [Desulfobacterales bacterium]